MRETFTQNRKSLLVMISMLFLAVIGGKAYAEVADNEEAGATSVSMCSSNLPLGINECE